MKFTRSKAFFAFCLITLLLLVAANHSSTPQKSLQEISYENWLQEKDNQFSQSDSPSTINPAITIHLFSNDSSKGINYLLSSGDFNEAHERIFRILNILQESNTFSETKWFGDSAEYISLVIDNGAQNFKTSLPFPKEGSDVKLRTMFKLFQLYALERDNKRAAMAKNEASDLGAE